MYHDLYALLQEYLFGLEPLTAYQDMVLTFVSTLGVLFVASLPFILVWRIIKLFG